MKDSYVQCYFAGKFDEIRRGKLNRSCSVYLAATPKSRASKFFGRSISAKKFRKGEVDWQALTHATYYSIVGPKGKTIEYNSLRRMVDKPIQFPKNIANYRIIMWICGKTGQFIMRICGKTPRFIMRICGIMNINEMRICFCRIWR